jgi:hypothetical protein
MTQPPDPETLFHAVAIAQHARAGFLARRQAPAWRPDDQLVVQRRPFNPFPT